MVVCFLFCSFFRWFMLLDNFTILLAKHTLFSASNSQAILHYIIIFWSLNSLNHGDFTLNFPDFAFILLFHIRDDYESNAEERRFALVNSFHTCAIKLRSYTLLFPLGEMSYHSLCFLSLFFFLAFLFMQYSATFHTFGSYHLSQIFKFIFGSYHWVNDLLTSYLIALIYMIFKNGGKIIVREKQRFELKMIREHCATK